MIDTQTSADSADSSSRFSRRIRQRYHIGQDLGTGGFSYVVQARDKRTGEIVAIKIINREHREYVGLIEREAKLLTRLQHPNIVRLVEIDARDGDRIYMVMEFIEGGDLDEYLKTEMPRLGVIEKIKILTQIAEGLHYVHTNGIVHHDMKPKNILRRSDGRLVIADFGLAKRQETAIYTSATQASADASTHSTSRTSLSSLIRGAGTTFYIAPEVLRDPHMVDYRSDLYSLGVMAYELFAGQKPFVGTPELVKEGHLQKQPPRLLQAGQDPELNRDIEMAVEKMLSKDPADRFLSAIDFARELQRAWNTRRAIQVQVPDKLISTLQENTDEVFKLVPGDYCGPFKFNRPLHLVGSGENTRLYVPDGVVLQIESPNVILENLTVQRTRPDDTESLIQAPPDISYILDHVYLQGGPVTPGAQWINTTWQSPINGLHLGDISSNFTLVKENILCEVSEECSLHTSVKPASVQLEVFPRHVLPGPHKLKITLSTTGVLPGTRLKGAIHLRPVAGGKSDERTLPLQATVIPSSVNEQPDKVAAPARENAARDLAIPAMSWVVQFRANGAEAFLNALAPEEHHALLNQYGSRKNDANLKRCLRDAARDYLGSQLRGKASLWYVRRLKKVSGKEIDQRERWGLTLAADNQEFPCPFSQLADKQHRTLILECEVNPLGESVLYIERALLLNAELGHKVAGGIPAVVCLLTSRPETYQGIPLDFVEQIQAEPIKEASRISEDQRKGWQDLLVYNLQRARKKQCWIKYTSYTYRDDAPTLTFQLDKDQAYDFEQNPIDYAELASQWKKARGDQLKYSPILSPANQTNRNPVIGEIVSLREDAGKLEIRLSPDFQKQVNQERVKLQEGGFLQYDATGDIVQIERQQDAFGDLEEGRAYNSHLGDFFFNSLKAKKGGKPQKLHPANLLMGTANEGQLQAVEGALATPELLLIQGPPGTGKTTVIAEICYQIGHQGGRTLIASQTNLAVDNALARIRHQNPQVRALRQGNAQSIEEEGQEYLQQQVVINWLQQISINCQQNQMERQQQIQTYEFILQDERRFQDFLQTLDINERRLQMLSLKQEEINDLLEQLAEEQRQLTFQVKNELEPVIAVLPSLLQGNLTARSTLTAAQLQQVFLHLFAQTPERQRFMREVLAAWQRMPTKQPASIHILLSLIALHQQMQDLTPAHTVASEQLTDLHKNQEELTHLHSQLQQQRQEQQKAEEQADQGQQDIGSVENTIKENDRLRSLLSTALHDAQNYHAQLTSDFTIYLQNEISRHKERDTPFQALQHQSNFPASLYALMQESPFEEAHNIWQAAQQTLYADILEAAQIQRELAQLRTNCVNWHRWQEDTLQQMPAIKDEMASYLQISSYCDRASVQSVLDDISRNYQEITKNRQSTLQHLLSGYKSQMRRLFGNIRNDLSTLYIYWQRASAESEARPAQLAQSYTSRFLADLEQWVHRRSDELAKARSTANERLQYLSSRRTHWLQAAETAEREQQQLTDALYRCGETQQDLCQHIADTDLLPAEVRQIAQAITLAPTRNLLDPETCTPLLAHYQQWLDSQRELANAVNNLWSAFQDAARQCQQTHTGALQRLEQNRLTIIEQQQINQEAGLNITRAEEQVQQERAWWLNFWQRIPADLHPFESATEIFLPEARALFTAQLRAWRQRLDEYKAISARFDSLLTDWIKDVEKVTPHERAWLEDLYIQNANVIGITCGQVNRLGRPDRSGNGVVINGYFDAVIIDEVSKATAPELLLPAMRGRKLILIGDHRQLPPVMEERTLDEMAEAEGKDPRSYDFLKQSYFKDRFLEAPPELKCQLTIQYRMHPDIMAAINQFYDIPLECGLTDPNVERHHGLTQSNLVRPNKHIIWVATPLARYTYQRQNERHLILHNRNTGNEALRIQTRHAHFGEGKVGTSYYNEREIEIIEGICADLQRSWYSQVKAAAKPKEIGVITFYGEQDTRLRLRLLPDQRRQAGRKPFDALAIRVGTVDRFQGMERPVVIVSMVRNNTEEEIGFAKEDERINVAFSRAQELLIIVGCHELFCEYGKSAPRYRKVAEIVKKLGEFIDVSAS